MLTKRASERASNEKIRKRNTIKIRNRWTNILKEMDNECARETIGKHLAEVTDFTGAMSVMELAEFDQYGNKEYEPHWPFMIEVEPYDVYGWTDKF